MSDYYEKQRASINIGLELERRGWDLWGFHGDQSDSMTDYYHPASWDGVATHKKYPGYVICVYVSGYVAQNSGKDAKTIEYVRDTDCVACDSGWATGELTYEDALLNPNEAHHIKPDLARGIRILNPFGSPVNKNYYFDDGRPKCLECHGDGYTRKSQEKYLFTWPTFQENPKRMFWHVEKNGRIIASGQGYKKWTDVYHEAGRRAVAAICDEIEGYVTRGNPGPAGPAVVQSAGKVQVTVEHTSAEGKAGVWTWIDIQPRIDRDQYRAFADHFGASWSKRRRRVYIPRKVEAADLIAWFNSPADEIETPDVTTDELEEMLDRINAVLNASEVPTIEELVSEESDPVRILTSEPNLPEEEVQPDRSRLTKEAIDEWF